jgi:hypothetical protein
MASTTERHCRPIDPVEPNMANCFKESFVECGSLLALSFEGLPLFRHPRLASENHLTYERGA